MYAPAEQGDPHAHPDMQLTMRLCCSVCVCVQVVYALAEHCDLEGDAKPWGVPGLGVKGLGPYFAR